MIEYRRSAEALVPSELEGFFVGWPKPPTPQRHLDILLGSSEVWIAYDTEASRVVGFVTALSDGVLSAFIPLLEVLPAYQSRGIGSELMERMLGTLESLYAVDLVCDADRQEFYEHRGMQPALAMMRRNYARQSAAQVDK